MTKDQKKLNQLVTYCSVLKPHAVQTIKAVLSRETVPLKNTEMLSRKPIQLSSVLPASALCEKRIADYADFLAQSRREREREEQDFCTYNLRIFSS